jgi:hypothetical protein
MIVHSNYTAVDLKLRTAENRQMLYEDVKTLIRRAFDRAVTSLEAESFIILAKEKGYHEMAEEMAQDLQTELSA